jgi:hypothetical protein
MTGVGKRPDKIFIMSTVTHSRDKFGQTLGQGGHVGASAPASHTPWLSNPLATFFFANRILALKKTTNSTKHPKKNKNYNEILEKPFIFNLQTVSTTRRRCRSFLSRPDVVGCEWEVAKGVKKTTSVPKMKKKEELSMKLLDNPKIPTARRNS